MIYQKLIPYYLILRELILKYIFGRIKMLNFKIHTILLGFIYHIYVLFY